METEETDISQAEEVGLKQKGVASEGEEEDWKQMGGDGTRTPSRVVFFILLFPRQKP